MIRTWRDKLGELRGRLDQRGRATGKPVTSISVRIQPSRVLASIADATSTARAVEIGV